jgi:hypothetical protein
MNPIAGITAAIIHPRLRSNSGRIGATLIHRMQRLICFFQRWIVKLDRPQLGLDLVVDALESGKS